MACGIGCTVVAVSTGHAGVICNSLVTIGLLSLVHVVQIRIILYCGHVGRVQP